MYVLRPKEPTVYYSDIVDHSFFAAMQTGSDDIQFGPVIGQGNPAGIRHTVFRVWHFAVETLLHIDVTGLFQLIYVRRKVPLAHPEC